VPEAATPAADVQPRVWRRGPARREAILDAAAELVGEIGYANVTVDAIATRARTSKATMYVRWPSKAELIADALLRHAQGDVPLVAVDTGELRGDLRAHVGRIVRSLCEGKLSALRVVEAIRDDPALRERVRTQIERASAEVGAQLVAQALARGEIPDQVDGGAVLMLAVGQLLTRALLDGQAPDPLYQLRLVDDVLLPMFHCPRKKAAARHKDHPSKRSRARA